MLALVGEPGIGKTALLDYAAGRADGMRVLRARGDRVGGARSRSPASPSCCARRSACFDRDPGAAGRPRWRARSRSGPAAAQDRFAIGAATLSLLSAYAEEAPLALLVDDAHLLDGSSAEALLFAARRLVADPIALVLAVREGEPSLLDGADLRSSRLAGLDRSDAAELLRARERARRGRSTGSTAATGGNPLALLELARRRRAVSPSCPPTVPCRSPRGSRRRSCDRFGLLAEPTRRLLVLVGRERRRRPGAARPRRGGARARRRATSAPAEEAGLVRLDGGARRVRAPARALGASTRGAVRAGAPRAHAALAGALPDRDVDRRAWHLAAASVGPDARRPSRSSRPAGRARERSAYARRRRGLRAGGPAGAGETARARSCSQRGRRGMARGRRDRTLALLDEAAGGADAPRSEPRSITCAVRSRCAAGPSWMATR